MIEPYYIKSINVHNQNSSTFIIILLLGSGIIKKYNIYPNSSQVAQYAIAGSYNQVDPITSITIFNQSNDCIFNYSTKQVKGIVKLNLTIQESGKVINR
jgi:hypothetical protein